MIHSKKNFETKISFWVAGSLVRYLSVYRGGVLLRTKLMCSVRAECSVRKFRRTSIRDDTSYNYKQLPNFNQINLS